MQNYTIQKTYVDKTANIQGKENKAWAIVARTNDTHINGVCPEHLYVERRPIESNNPYAFDYRVKNFQPTTREAFDKALGGMQRVLMSANISIDKDKRLEDIFIEGKNIKDYCLTELVRIREHDPNAIILVFPKVRGITDTSVAIDGFFAKLFYSKDIVSKNDSEIVVKESDYKIVYNKEGINKVVVKDGVEIKTNIISFEIQSVPYVKISSLIATVNDVEVSRGYFAGAIAWGDKYYSQETDLLIQATNNTYVKEIRYKPKCNALGMHFKNGVHCSIDTGDTCGKCGGAGHTAASSPMGIVEVSYDADDSEITPLQNIIQYAEPPQNAIKTSEGFVDKYYNNMCQSLGLVSQNLTNQSGISKSFDYIQKLDIINAILIESMRIIKDVYTIATQIIDKGGNYNEVSVTSISELTDGSISDVMTKITEAKNNNLPPFIQEKYVDNLILKTLGNSETTQKIIYWAKKIDKLYLYGTNDLAIARAQLGNSITTQMVEIHNGIIRDLQEWFMANDVDTDPTAFVLAKYPIVATTPLF